MPQGNRHLNGNFGRGKRDTSLSTEEAAGIGFLIVVLAALVIIGCWYYKKRRGYKNLLSKNFRMATMKTLEGRSALLGSKLALQDYNSNCNYVVPDAPPAYDKISTSPLPPPYAP